MSSPTPGLATSKPPLFANMMFFIDPGMTGRPQLIKQLRDHGMGKLRTTPRDARVILVSLSTNSGRQFVRDWGADPSKVVLRSAWAQECISQGRALLENDEWGGFLAEDDGLPIEDEGDDDDIAPQPFSTQQPPFREQSGTSRLSMGEALRSGPSNATPTTPSATSEQNHAKTIPSPPSLKAQTAAQRQKQTNGIHAVQAPIPSPASVQYSSPQANGVSNSPSPNNLQIQQPGPHSNSLPSSQPSSVPPTPIHNVYQSVPLANAHDFQTAQQAQANSLAHPYQATHMANAQVAYSQMLPTSQQTQTNGTPGYLSQSGPFSQVAGTQAPLQFVPPVSGQYPPMQDPYALHPVSYGNIVNPFHAQPMQPFGYPYNGAYPPMQPPTDVSIASPRSTSPHREHNSSDDEPSLSGRKLRRKGKRKVKRETRSPQLEEEGEQEVQEIPEPPSQSQRPLKKGGGPRFFLKESGDALCFFFQVEGMPNRSNVVKETKNRGGVIVADVGKADYAVLRAGSKEFKTAFTQCKHSGTPAVKINFILDSLDEGKVLDWHAYSFDDEVDPGPAKRRGQKTSTPAKRRASLPAAKEKKPAIKRVAEEGVSPRDTGDKRQKLAPTSEGESSSESPSKKPRGDLQENAMDTDPASTQISPSDTSSNPYYRPSPPPPPIHTRKLFTEGRYRYTEEDMACAAEYVQILLERDVKMPTQAIAAKLQVKMPYHSANSWTTRMQKLELEGRREKIERRIRLHGNPYGKDAIQQHQQPADTPGSAISRKAERRAAEDFDCIVSFFTSGGGDEGEDEEVWERLEKKRCCQSANSWPEFYSSNKPAIDDAIKEFVERKGGQMN